MNIPLSALEFDRLTELEFDLEPEYEAAWEAEFASRLKGWARKAAQAVRGAAVAGAIATAPFLPPEVHRQVVRIAQILTQTKDPKDAKKQPQQLPDRPAAGSAPPPRASQRRRQQEAELALRSRIPIPPQALMEYLGYAAATAETETEAIAFIGALPALTTKLYPQTQPLLKTTSPALQRGLTVATRSFHRHPSTRLLIQAIPTIFRHTLLNLHRQQQQGQSVTPGRAAKNLMNQSYTLLTDPQQTQQALQRANTTLQRYSSQRFATEAELEIERALREIEHMAKGQKRQMTSAQKAQIMQAIEDSICQQEHTRGRRSSTREDHEEAKARRRREKWKRAQRIFQTQGFQTALKDAKR